MKIDARADSARHVDKKVRFPKTLLRHLRLWRTLQLNAAFSMIYDPIPNLRTLPFNLSHLRTLKFTTQKSLCYSVVFCVHCGEYWPRMTWQS